MSGLSVTAVLREENEPGRGLGGGGQKPAEKWRKDNYGKAKERDPGKKTTLQTPWA